jgi:hypothetical protein
MVGSAEWCIAGPQSSASECSLSWSSHKGNSNNKRCLYARGALLNICLNYVKAGLASEDNARRVNANQNSFRNAS